MRRDAECLAAGGDVICTLYQSDVFGDRAGIPPVAIEQPLRIAAGLIVELGEQSTSGASPDQEEAWLEQFAAYEEWLAASHHPEVFAQAFRDPCCSGTPNGMVFSPESIAAHRAVIDEWTQSS